MRRFNEGTNVVAAVTFLDSDNSPSIPSTVHYRLRNTTANRTVIDWTSVSPATALEIDIPAQSVAIVSQSRRTERQQLTVVANKDTAAQITEVVEWIVVNLDAVN